MQFRVGRWHPIFDGAGGHRSAREVRLIVHVCAVQRFSQCALGGLAAGDKFRRLLQDLAKCSRPGRLFASIGRRVVVMNDSRVRTRRKPGDARKGALSIRVNQIPARGIVSERFTHQPHAFEQLAGASATTIQFAKDDSAIEE